jgi:hypothetical protein
VELNRLLEDIPVPESLAGEEFTEAWAPSPEGGERATPESMHSVSVAAADAIRAQEARIQAAKTEEERSSARKDADVFRISLVFSGQEAVMVRQALGERPAEALLNMCKAWAPSSSLPVA